MNEENSILNSLPEKVDELIDQIQSDTSVANALIYNKNFYNHFDSVLNDLSKLISGKRETSKEYSQISADW